MQCKGLIQLYVDRKQARGSSKPAPIVNETQMGEHERNAHKPWSPIEEDKVENQ